ncbi:hypothetical protein BJ912DRAFT_1053392 [Pholiota molesta]|nr:hypothetical protein BJ912DRAFT_1053392 [Pholiota molesta]
MQLTRNCRPAFSTFNGAHSSAPLRYTQLCNHRISFRLYHADAAPVEPLKLPHGYRSLLPLVHECNNLVLPHIPWHTDKLHTIATRTADGSMVNEEAVIPFLISHDQQEKPIVSPWDLKYSNEQNKVLKAVAFADWVNEGGKYTRTMHMERLVSEWKKQNIFKEILRGWSDEAYPVYVHPPQDLATTVDPVAFAIERAALPLFGFVNFGALLTAYVRDPATGRIMLWIPRRSAHKRTWPGALDVTQKRLSSTRTTSRMDPPRRCITFPQPLSWWLDTSWDVPPLRLPLPADGSLIPRINALDGEVEKFELIEAETVLQYLLEGQFKSSSALAILDFLMRHGYITEETDPRYLDVCRHLKTDIKLPVSWRPHI